jgi:hypothetical protein
MSNLLNEILKDCIPKENKYKIHSEGLESTPVKGKVQRMQSKKM